RKYEFYINFLKEEIKRCQKLGFNKMVLHPGSSVSLEKNVAIENIANGINKALQEIEGFDLVLEFMSGKGTEVGTSIEDFEIILSKIEKKDNVSICLDTCHLNDAGVSIEDFELFLNDFDEKIGIDKIHVLHINDSKNVRTSHKDRHENIGYGTIGFDNLINVIYNERLKNIPKILETPYIDKKAPYKEEIEMIRNRKYKDFINL
ncbi:MAG: deoxyribonuclease IV, partial [Bacilli bacterium]|nr:deoxyribonuclease IV [Bacilli bacterium]